MNFWGAVPQPRGIGRPPELRKSFPVKYALIDFGCSLQFSSDETPARRRGFWPVPREQRAPEAVGGNDFDPFAADVYQTGRTIYGWCQVRFFLLVLFQVTLPCLQKFIADIPGVLAVLQDMTRLRAELRLSAAEAFMRMSMAVHPVSELTKATELPTCQLDEFDPVPCRTMAYVYGYSPY